MFLDAPSGIQWKVTWKKEGSDKTSNRNRPKKNGPKNSHFLYLSFKVMNEEGNEPETLYSHLCIISLAAADSET